MLSWILLAFLKLYYDPTHTFNKLTEACIVWDVALICALKETCYDLFGTISRGLTKIYETGSGQNSWKSQLLVTMVTAERAAGEGHVTKKRYSGRIEQRYQSELESNPKQEGAPRGSTIKTATGCWWSVSLCIFLRWLRTHCYAVCCWHVFISYNVFPGVTRIGVATGGNVSNIGDKRICAH